MNLSIGTQEIRFGRKKDEIAKFSILDEKRNSQFWRKNGQLIGVIAEQVVKFFHNHWHYHNAFTVGSKEWMPRIIGM